MRQPVPAWFALLGVCPLALLSPACVAQPAVDDTVVVETPADAALLPGGVARVFGDEVVIANDAIALAVSPRVGRVVWFGPAGGENLMWINEAVVHEPADDERATWHNYGGDKVWPTVQPLWPRFLPGGGDWPPDGVIDGQPWELIEHTGDRITIESRYSEAMGVRVRRTFALSAPDLRDDAMFAEVAAQAIGGVVIETTLSRPLAHAAPLSVWAVTQVRRPAEANLHTARPTHAGPYLTMMGEPDAGDALTVDDANGAVAWDLTGGAEGKLGTLGRFIAAHFDDENLIFLQRHEFHAHAAYADATSVQAYAGGEYLELELLGPTVAVPAGGSTSHTIEWVLIATARE